MFGIFHKRSKQADIIGRLRKCSDVESYTSVFIVQVVRSEIRRSVFAGQKDCQRSRSLSER